MRGCIQYREMAKTPRPSLTDLHVPATNRSLRVVDLAQSDQTGGANRAAYRLHRALRESGIDSVVHPGRKLGNDPDVVPAWPPLFGREVSHLIAWIGVQEVLFRSRKSHPLFSSVTLSYGMPRERIIA